MRSAWKPRVLRRGATALYQRAPQVRLRFAGRRVKQTTDILARRYSVELERMEWRKPRAFIGTDCRFNRIARDSCACARPGDEADIQVARGDDSDARWSETPDRNLDAGGPAGAAADSVSTHALRSSRKTAGADARVMERVGTGWLHLRHSKFARAIQV